MQIVPDDADIGIVELDAQDPLRQWEVFIARSDIVGGDIETQEDGNIYRGPIQSIELSNRQVSVSCSWMAVMESNSGNWKNWHIKGISFTIGMCLPQDIGKGRIYFRMPGLGHATIFPCGGSKLDPAKVEGLVLEQP